MSNEWAKFLKLYDKQYHIFVNYCQDDTEIVLKLLDNFNGLKCVVNDPDNISICSKSILRNAIFTGIQESKVTVLFVTKRYLSDKLCKYATSLAIWKYVTSRGNHRVFPVILEPCRIPRCLKVLNCIHVWKYALNIPGNNKTSYHVHIATRMIRAFTVAPPKFRRKRWSGMKTSVWSIYKQTTMPVRVCQESDHIEKQRRKLLYINCRHRSQCIFPCSSLILNMLLHKNQHSHYKPVCPHEGCIISYHQWALRKYLECQFVVQCLCRCCGRLVRKNRLTDHLKTCSARVFECPNLKLGCKEQLKLNEVTDHMAACPFSKINCKKCGGCLLNKDMKDHNQICVKCSLCKMLVLGGDENSHIRNVCKMATVKCCNDWCDVNMKRYQVLDHNFICSARFPKSCGFCGETISRSEWKGHEMLCRTVAEKENIYSTVAHDQRWSTSWVLSKQSQNKDECIQGMTNKEQEEIRGLVLVGKGAPDMTVLVDTTHQEYTTLNRNHIPRGIGYPQSRKRFHALLYCNLDL